MPKLPKINERQRKYAAGILKGKSKTAAAKEAGYSDAMARNAGERIENNKAVKRYIAGRLAKQELSADRVLEELRRIAFINIGEFFDENGNLRHVKDLGDAGSAVASTEVLKRNFTAGDGKLDEIHKIKLWDKVKALDTLAKHFGLLVEKVDHSGALTIRWMTEDEAKQG